MSKKTAKRAIKEYMEAVAQVFGEDVAEEATAELGSDNSIEVTLPGEEPVVYSEDELVAATEGMLEAAQDEDAESFDSETPESEVEDITEEAEEFENDEVDEPAPEPEVDMAAAESREYQRIANRIRDRVAINLEVGLFVHEQKMKHDRSYEDVKSTLAEAYEAELPNKSSVSRWAQAAEGWVTNAGAPVSELTSVSVYKLYHSRNSVNEDNWREILDWLKQSDVTEADAKARYSDASDSTPTDFKSIRMRREMFDLLDASRRRFGTAATEDPNLSWEMFLQTWEQIIRASSDEEIKAVWEREHGSVDESDPDEEVEVVD